MPQVLGDLGGEAKEVAAANPWLNYCLPLQRAREFGLSDRIFDLLDEGPMLPSEVRTAARAVLPLFAVHAHRVRSFRDTHLTHGMPPSRLASHTPIPCPRALLWQVKNFCELIFDASFPEPDLSPADFITAVTDAQTCIADEYDPLTYSKRPWVDVDKLAQHLDENA